MCNCIKDIEQKMQHRMLDEISKKGGNNYTITEKAEFDNKGIYFGDVPGRKPIFLYLRVEGKYRRGKQNNVWGQNILFSYCPFCGEKLTGKEAGEDE